MRSEPRKRVASSMVRGRLHSHGRSRRQRRGAIRLRQAGSVLDHPRAAPHPARIKAQKPVAGTALVSRRLRLLSNLVRIRTLSRRLDPTDSSLFSSPATTAILRRARVMLRSQRNGKATCRSRRRARAMLLLAKAMLRSKLPVNRSPTTTALLHRAAVRHLGRMVVVGAEDIQVVVAVITAADLFSAFPQPL